ncbi:hypothetical protein BS47DRAFT_1294590 [Hydnum rufescens UP504]|uniref:ATP-dependent DNA helicase n=1 Tax=Hydnum rufescens UP504 TaxID=1448309 RepID=A0A9P6B0W6_9AGAM|nr:hypothetical protein BS47DRAFT_1294590 [Hydnum rufescens UP504]
MRNLSIERNLTKNTKVVIHELGQRIIAVKPIRQSKISEEILLLPRIDFTQFVDFKGWTIKRKQFPLRLGYASTFNSAQGQTLQRVGIDLTQPVFTHGQLYTAISRVQSREDCLIRLPIDATSVPNVVFPELLS